MTTTQVNDLVGKFIVKLRSLKTENHYFLLKSPLNENVNNFNEKLDDKNYKRTVKKLNDVGWGKSFHFR